MVETRTGASATKIRKRQCDRSISFSIFFASNYYELYFMLIRMKSSVTRFGKTSPLWRNFTVYGNNFCAFIWYLAKLWAYFGKFVMLVLGFKWLKLNRPSGNLVSLQWSRRMTGSISPAPLSLSASCLNISINIVCMWWGQKYLFLIKYTIDPNHTIVVVPTSYLSGYLFEYHVLHLRRMALFEKWIRTFWLK